MSPSQKAVIRERRIRLFFFLMSLILLFVVLTQVQNLLVSIILAFVNYYLLAPSVNWMERHGLSRLWATTLPFLLMTVIIFIATYLFLPAIGDQLSALEQNLPKYTDAVNSAVTHLESQLKDLTKSFFPLDLRGHLQPLIASWTSVFFQKLPQYASQSLTILFLVPLLTYFMLLDGRDFVRRLMSLAPNNLFELFLNLNHQIGFQLGGFIRARLLESVLVGLTIWTGLLLLDFPYALLLAVVAGVLNVIPYLGPLLGALPAFLISFANDGGANTELLSLFAIYGIAQVIDAAILVPFLVAKIVDLHPITVILSILIGSQVMGVLGMIICIPVVSVLKVTTQALYRHFTGFRT